MTRLRDDDRRTHPAPRARWSAVGAVLLVAAGVPLVLFPGSLVAVAVAGVMVVGGGLLVRFAGRTRRRP